MKRQIKNNEEFFTTGAYIIKKDNQYIVQSFEDDSYFNGLYIEDLPNNPYVNEEER